MELKNEPLKKHQARIELVKSHEHAGKLWDPGAKLTMHADSAKWLISIGVAKPAA